MLNHIRQILVICTLLLVVTLYTACAQNNLGFIDAHHASLDAQCDLNRCNPPISLPPTNIDPVIALDESEIYTSPIEISADRIHLITLSPDTTKATIEGSITVLESATEFTIDVPTGKTLTINGAIQSFSPIQLTKTGGGTLILTGSNSLPSGIAIQEGTLQFSNAVHLGGGPLKINQGTLQLINLPPGSYYSDATATVPKTITLSQSIELGTQDIFFKIADTKTLTLTGQISGPGGYTVTGKNGTLKLANTVANTYSGVTYISDAMLLLASPTLDAAIRGDRTKDTNCSDPDVIVQAGGELKWANGDQLEDSVTVVVESSGRAYGKDEANWVGPSTHEKYHDLCNAGFYSTGRGMTLELQ